MNLFNFEKDEKNIFGTIGNLVSNTVAKETAQIEQSVQSKNATSSPPRESRQSTHIFSTPKTTEKDTFLEGFNYASGAENVPQTEVLPASFSMADKIGKNLAGSVLTSLQTPITKEEGNDAFLEGFNFYSQPDSKATTKKLSQSFLPFGTTISKKTDDFLSGFNDPYGENEKSYKERSFTVLPNSDANELKKKFISLKYGTLDPLETAKIIGKRLINNASMWANEKGFFDDVTNDFFKAYDFSQDYPFKKVPTDLMHFLLANRNHKINQEIDLSRYDEFGGYINDQNSGEVGQIKYGAGTFDDNGCGVIAVNNALVSLGNRKDIRDVSKAFETDGQTLFGLLGTSPFAIGDFFRREGYSVDTYEGDQTIYNLDIPDADAYILSFWNSNKVTDMIHTVAMKRLPNGKFRIYNEGRSPTKDISSLNAYFFEKNRVPLVLHCIRKGR